MINMLDVQRGYDAWAAKPHNAKWVRKIDGTPIANDIVATIWNTLRDTIDERTPAPVPDVSWKVPTTAPNEVSSQRPNDLVTTENGSLVNGQYIYALEVAADCWKALAEKQQAAPAPNVVPEGWRLVPIKADDRMIYAINEWTDKNPPDFDRGYGDADSERLYDFITSLEDAPAPAPRKETP